MNTAEEMREQREKSLGPYGKALSYRWKDVLWAKEVSEEEDPPAEPVDFIGQPDVMNQLEPWLTKERPFPHVLIKGEPGLGKTQLGRWIAWKRQEPFTEIMCPVKPSDFPDRGVVLLDEAHLIKKPEWMYPRMEGGVPTVIAATTRPDKLDGPFRSRFFVQVHLERYELEDMTQIIRNLAPEATEEEVQQLAKATAGSPRQATRLISTAEGLGTYDPRQVLATARITADGLTDDHIKYMMALRSVNRPTGVGQIAILVYGDEDGVKQLERLLLSRGLIELSNGGRTLTNLGQKYLRQILKQ